MSNYKRYTINNTSIKTAMKIMEVNSDGILFVLDKRSKLVGSITDGDCRRYFLKGGLYLDKVTDAMNSSPHFLHQNAPISDKMQLANKYGVVPIVNSQHIVVNVFTTKTSKTIQVSNPYLVGDEGKYLLECIESGWISSGGKFVRDFESKLGHYLGGLNSVLVSNGTVALQLALTALGIGKDDEVIVPNLTFGATINAVLAIGAKPVIVSIEESNWNIDPDVVLSSIGPNTKAIIVVDLYGVKCDLDKISSITQSKNIKLIVDAAESMAHYLSKDSEAVADAYTLSFFANKIITTGEGGAIVFKNRSDQERALIQRDHGMSKERRYYHIDQGYNYRLTNMQAAVGMAQLERIEEILAKRKVIWNYYYDSLRNLPEIKFQESILDATPWLFTVRISNVDIDKLQNLLAAIGIETRRIFVPLSDMNIFKALAVTDGSIAKRIYNNAISLPTYAGLSKKDQTHVIKSLEKCIKQSRLSPQEAEVKD